MQKSPALFEGNPLPMWIHDIASLRFLEVNESAQRQYGYTRQEFLSLTLDDLRYPDDSTPPQSIATGVIDPDKTCAHRKKDGTKIYVNMRANEVRFGGHAGRFVVAEDVTERRHKQAQLFQLAHHDALTGLANRTLLQQQMIQVFSRAKEEGRRAAIVCLDLDRFKQINDWYGHAIGDECLKQMAIMLTRRLRGMDTVARTGGEEFTILLGEVEGVLSAGIVAKALLQAFSNPIEIEGHKILLGASIGVAVYPDHGTDASKLWRSADAAMYRAKRAGGNRHVVAASSNSLPATESQDVDARLRSMLQNDEFQLHYQLQYDLNRKIRGMEALLRLPNLKEALVSPDRFITIAEDTGLIHPLGKWVLEEACQQLKRWNLHRNIPVRVAINVSPLQLMQSEFVSEVRTAVSQSGIDPAWLEMEITERVVLNTNEIAERMTELARMGIRFAIDDFGTGYSSLQHLHQLPVSTLKIDCSFIQQLCESSRSYSLVKSIIAMGHSLHMEVIAEGVEHEDQMRVLQELNCDFIQGFLLSQPSSPETIEFLLNSTSTLQSKS
jgi:diguanylate cyclase (GGDEF)-like protein/PAS domain S-box-containing protein